jgi:hypothetical protein
VMLVAAINTARNMEGLKASQGGTKQSKAGGASKRKTNPSGDMGGGAKASRSLRADLSLYAEEDQEDEEQEDDDDEKRQLDADIESQFGIQSDEDEVGAPAPKKPEKLATRSKIPRKRKGTTSSSRVLVGGGDRSPASSSHHSGSQGSVNRRHAPASPLPPQAAMQDEEQMEDDPGTIAFLFCKHQILIINICCFVVHNLQTSILTTLGWTLRASCCRDGGQNTIAADSG